MKKLLGAIILFTLLFYLWGSHQHLNNGQQLNPPDLNNGQQLNPPDDMKVTDHMKTMVAFGTVLSIVYIRDCNGKTTDRAAKAAWSNYINPEFKPYIDYFESGFKEGRAKQGDDVAYCMEIRRAYLRFDREMSK